MSTDSSSVSPRSSPGSGEIVSSGTSAKGRSQRTLAPNLTRRTHTKSRGGCFACKSRKIKCQETRPACENCLLKDLTCGYQASASRASRVHGTPSTVTTVARPNVTPSNLSSVTDTFTIDDLRCFHHFLTMAYPHLPTGNDTVWVQTIPQFAQQHDYLMHAMLALGASHLDKMVFSNDHRVLAMVHRGQAMKGLNRAMAESGRHYGDTDSMLATLFALAFQSAYLKDGIADFMTLVKGCHLLLIKAREDQTETAFDLRRDWDMLTDGPITSLDHVLGYPIESLPPVHPALVHAGIQALNEVHVTLTALLHYELHTSLLAVLTSLLQSLRLGFLKFCRLRPLLSGQHFDHYMDASDKVCQLLLTYFIAMQMLLVPVTKSAWTERADRHILHGIIDWFHTLVDHIPSTFHQYLAWPAQIMATVKAEADGVAYDGPPVLGNCLWTRDPVPGSIYPHHHRSKAIFETFGSLTPPSASRDLGLVSAATT